ncbi:GPW/gp25 family protein [Chryseobacterium sp. MFBS3-17]|uniref:GPW/gp25 family protein n=1 Tax=Chryseobacterium sp. MFBS3-17 TaxID=2886689 RepID=UPI001D0E2BDA|nr:GPW/gp25 family protein [Chryseobacterium sp. MFBS3-17]MCC2590650.1 GPW/gp25 family protein [Chryseobacterium sp. MFBS3-17]
MDQKNYSLPFNPSAVMVSNGTISTCSMGESIAQNIMLLIITKQGENRYDEKYGNDVWSVEFDNGVSPAMWENIFINSLKRQIAQYETRITQPVIQAHITYVEHNYETRNFTEVKKKVKVGINAKIESTGEHFSFSTELFLSPMSID